MRVKQGVVTGLSGAATVAVIDGVVDRVTNSRATRIGARLAAAGALAYGASKAGASDAIVDGVIAGPVLVTAFDLAITTIGRRRLDPPQGELGQPWTPQRRISAGAAVGLLAAVVGAKVAYGTLPEESKSLIGSWWGR